MEDLRINKEEFNGWHNRETWAAALYIGNDQGLNDQAAELLGAAFDKGSLEGETVKDRRRAGIARAGARLDEWIESLFTRKGYEGEYGGEWPAALADMASDIGSLYRVDYYEIAEALLEDKLAAFDTEAAA
jgi:hypothetical protein